VGGPLARNPNQNQAPLQRERRKESRMGRRMRTL
jgi:hypothetical protein